MVQPVQRDQVGDFYVRNNGGDTITDANPNGHYTGSPDTNGLIIDKTNISSALDSLQVRTAGSGRAGYFLGTGTGKVLVVERSNISATAPVVEIINNSAADQFNATGFKIDYTGKTTISQNLDVSGALSVNDHSTFSDGATFEGHSIFDDDVSFNGNIITNLNLTKALNVTGDINAAANVNVSGNISGTNIKATNQIDASGGFGPLLQGYVLDNAVEFGIFQVVLGVPANLTLFRVSGTFDIWSGTTLGVSSADVTGEYRGLSVSNFKFPDGTLLSGLSSTFLGAKPYIRLIGAVGGIPDFTFATGTLDSRFVWELNDQGILWFRSPSYIKTEPSYFRAYLNFQVLLKKAGWQNYYSTAFVSPDSIPTSDPSYIWKDGYDISRPEVSGGTL